MQNNQVVQLNKCWEGSEKDMLTKENMSEDADFYSGFKWSELNIVYGFCLIIDLSMRVKPT